MLNNFTEYQRQVGLVDWPSAFPSCAPWHMIVRARSRSTISSMTSCHELLSPRRLRPVRTMLVTKAA